MQDKQQNIDKKSSAVNFDIKNYLSLVLSKWYWFVISLAVTFSCAWIKIAMTTPMYTSSMAVLIKDEDSKGSLNDGGSVDLSALGITQTYNNLFNEMRIIKSPLLMVEVVERLGLNDVCYVDRGLRKEEIYRKSPLAFKSLDSVSVVNYTIKFNVTDGKNVEVKSARIDGVEYKKENISAQIGDTISIGGYEFALMKPEWGTSAYNNIDIEFTHMSPKSMAGILSSGVETYHGNDNSSIIDIKITNPVIGKANDVLRTLLDVYEENWIKDKNQVAIATSQFIEDRLNVIANELGEVESDISSYKSQHLMPSIEAATQKFLSQSSSAENAIYELTNQIALAEMIKRELIAGGFDRLLPVISDGVTANIGSLLSQYNQIVLERNRLLETSSEKNPLVKDKMAVLQTLRGNILASINSSITSLRTQLSAAQRQISVSSGKLAENPGQAKYLMNIERQQKVKESLFLFLLQKREENELSQAFTAYNTRLISEPGGSYVPITPQKSKIWGYALIIGLAIPLLILYMREILDTKVRGKRDIESLTIPYIGEIPTAYPKPRGFARLKRRKNDDKRAIVVQPQSRDAINEAFRVFRTNIEFIGNSEVSAAGKAKVIAITSSNPGSGKTFVSMNLSKVLAIKGLKVLVIDMDLRKGSLSSYFGKPKPGITDYIVGKASESDIIKQAMDGTSGLDVIGIGTMPPNPAELLSSDKLDNLLADFKTRYDYIILDCPPVEIVTDALVINRLVDLTVFIIRSGKFDKDQLEIIQEYYDTNRYHNLAILLNGTDIYSGYGYHRYGYHRYGYRKYGYEGYISSK